MIRQREILQAGIYISLSAAKDAACIALPLRPGKVTKPNHVHVHVQRRLHSLSILTYSAGGQIQTQTDRTEFQASDSPS